MKALEMLKQELHSELYYIALHSILETSRAKALKEAIAELEELMKPKSCANCKESWESNNQTFHKFRCSYLDIPVHGNFYCNRYNPKDNK